MLPRKKWCGGISSTKAWPQPTTVQKSACCTFNLKSSPSSTNSRPQAKWSQLVPGPASGSFLSSWFQATNPQDFTLPLIYVSLFKWLGRPQTSKGTPGIQTSWGTQQTEPSEWCEVQPHHLGNWTIKRIAWQMVDCFQALWDYDLDRHTDMRHLFAICSHNIEPWRKAIKMGNCKFLTFPCKAS